MLHQSAIAKQQISPPNFSNIQKNPTILFLTDGLQTGWGGSAVNYRSSAVREGWCAHCGATCRMWGLCWRASGHHDDDRRRKGQPCLMSANVTLTNTSHTAESKVKEKAMHSIYQEAVTWLRLHTTRERKTGTSTSIYHRCTMSRCPRLLKIKFT